MDYSKAGLIVCITLLLVIGLNLVIYFQFGKQSKGRGTTIEYLQEAAKRARNPWEQEDANLRELSERVARFEDIEEADKKD